MAIAIDNSGNIDYNPAATAISTSYTCTGSNLVLVAFFGQNGATTPTLTATYNGVAMTAIGSIAPVNGSATRGYQTFVLVNPATGSNTIQFNTTISAGLEATFASYTGCSQSGVPDGHNEGSPTTGTSASSSITVSATGCWVVCHGLNDNGNGVDYTGSGVITAFRQKSATTSSSLLDSSGTVSTGSQTYGWVSGAGSGSGGLSISAVSIAPVATKTAHNLSLMGVGG